MAPRLNARRLRNHPAVKVNVAHTLRPRSRPRVREGTSSGYFSYNVFWPAAAASSNQRGKQHARVKPRHIPNPSAGRATYLAFLFGVFESILFG